MPFKEASNAAVSALKLPFKEAIDFFKAKVLLPSSGWTDLWKEQHSHAFVVAGAMQDDLVSDLYNAVAKAQAEGTGYAAFKDKFTEIVDKHGWAHKGKPGWRSRVIYDTNLTQAYNAGRYAQMWELRDVRPYWEYEHTSIENPRPQHRSWDGIILPADDAWWNSHYPQNGWGCKCRVRSHSQSSAQRAWQSRGKDGPDSAPPTDYDERTVGKNSGNPRTVRVPKGIDPGFDYNPGKAALEPFCPKMYPDHTKVLQARGFVFPKTDLAALQALGSKYAPFADGIEPISAVQAFLLHFGGTLEQAAVAQSVADVPLVISKNMFIKGADKSLENWKFDDDTKAGRFKYLMHLAEAISDPQEVWQVWEPWGAEPGKWILQRYYLRKSVVTEGGKERYLLAVFRYGSDGFWNGVTTFHSSNKQYPTNKRDGKLLYKK